MIRIARVSILGALALAACAPAGNAPESERAGSQRASGTASSASACQGTGSFESIPVDAACWIEIAPDDGEPVRVSYTIPTSGWSAFIGAFKEVEDGGDTQLVSVLIARVANVMVDACVNQVATVPPVGPSVDDLALALSELPPFEASAPPTAVTAFGYSGTHVQIRVPLDQPFSEDSRTFTGCSGSVLESWIAPPLSPAFYGYAAPGDTEDFWILDVEGTRVVIAALATANASDALLAEQQTVLDSLVIEP